MSALLLFTTYIMRALSMYTCYSLALFLIIHLLDDRANNDIPHPG